MSPSLQVDTRFAPPTGIVEYDFASGIATDRALGVAVDGDRIYTVGESLNGGNRDVAITARRSDGTFDPGFSEDGRVLLALRPALGSREDSADDVAVLPDHRILVLAATAANPLATADIEVALLRLNADGSVDTTFGDGTGAVVFPVSVNADVPARMAVDPASGRIAIAGGTGGAGLTGGRDDTFISLREPDGSPVAGFGTDGVVKGDFPGAALRDRAVDVAWRPDGGVVALVEAESAPNVLHSTLYGLSATGALDPAFGGTGVVELAVGDPDTTAGGLLAAGGRLWISGSTRTGNDTDAFLARVGMDGTGLQSRRFDFHGRAFSAAQGLTSTGRDLALLPGPVPTIVVTGKVVGDTGSAWGAAAFNTLDGDLTAAQTGDLTVGATGTGIAAVAAAAADWLAVAGTTEETTSDTNFATARLLVDADKTCDLGLSVTTPLEVIFSGSRPGPAPLTLRVANAGTRPCAGVVTAGGAYRLRGSGLPAPIATGTVAPGEAAVLPAVDVAYTGPRRRSDVLSLAVRADGDTVTDNDAANLRVNFRYCDARLARGAAVRAIPSEGRLRVPLLLSNAGTASCPRAGVAVAAGGRAVAVPPRATLDPGRQVDADATIEVTPVARGVKSATLRLRALATDDAETSDDLAITAPVVVVGDSAIRRAGARSVSGSATGGGGAASKAGRRVQAVHVAIRRLGAGCQLAGGVRRSALAEGLREDVRRASGLDPGARDGALVADASARAAARGATSSSRGPRSRPGSPKRASARATATSAACGCGERPARSGRRARRRRARGLGLWRGSQRARARQRLSRRRRRRADCAGRARSTARTARTPTSPPAGWRATRPRNGWRRHAMTSRHCATPWRRSRRPARLARCTRRCCGSSTSTSRSRPRPRNWRPTFPPRARCWPVCRRPTAGCASGSRRPAAIRPRRRVPWAPSRSRSTGPWATCAASSRRPCCASATEIGSTPWPAPPHCQGACAMRCATATPCAPRACSTSSSAPRRIVARSRAKRSTAYNRRSGQVLARAAGRPQRRGVAQPSLRAVLRL